MNFKIKALTSKADGGDMCLMDSATKHTILKENKFCLILASIKAKINTISKSINLTKSSRRAIILLKNGTKLCINDVLYSSKFIRNLLSFKDIRNNGYHIEIMSENSTEFIYITINVFKIRLILEKLFVLSSGLYYTI